MTNNGEIWRFSRLFHGLWWESAALFRAGSWGVANILLKFINETQKGGIYFLSTLEGAALVF